MSRAGMVLGFDREMRGIAAGIRTHGLVGLSSAVITVSALLPVYLRLGMRPIVLAGVVALGAGVMNMVPWGGPLGRTAAATGIDPVDCTSRCCPFRARAWCCGW